MPHRLTRFLLSAASDRAQVSMKGRWSGHFKSRGDGGKTINIDFVLKKMRSLAAFSSKYCVQLCSRRSETLFQFLSARTKSIKGL